MYIFVSYNDSHDILHTDRNELICLHRSFLWQKCCWNFLQIESNSLNCQSYKKTWHICRDAISFARLSWRQELERKKNQQNKSIWLIADQLKRLSLEISSTPTKLLDILSNTTSRNEIKSFQNTRPSDSCKLLQLPPIQSCLTVLNNQAVPFFI